MGTSNSSFVRGAAILAVTGIAARIVGAVFRIILAAILGDEGIGLYQYAYPIYSTLLVISTAGIPVALSKIMAEKIAMREYSEAMRAFRIAFVILMLSGLAIFFVLLLGAEFIAATVIRDMKAVYPLMAISPAIFFVTIMASLRGFFQGQQNMLPTALSQLIEQLVRVGFALGLVLLYLPVGIEYAAAGATSGAAAGGLAGLLFLAFLYWRNRRFLWQEKKSQSSNPESVSRIINRILSLAVPVTIGGLVIPLISLIDLAVVPRQLQAAGFDIASARALYGQLTGMAGSVVYFPNVVALALSMSLVPAISEAYTLKNDGLIRSRSAVAVKLTALFSIPSAVGLFVLAEPITVLLFNNAEAGYPLAWMSWSVIPLCIYVSTTGLIQGLGKAIVPALNMLYGGIVKTILAWHLTAIPSLNVGGSALASVIGLAVAAALNLYYVRRFTGWRGKVWELLVLPGIASAAMALTAHLIYTAIAGFTGDFLSGGLLNLFATLTAIALGIIVYFAVLLLSGGFTGEELQMLPFIGRKLALMAIRFRKKSGSN